MIGRQSSTRRFEPAAIEVLEPRRFRASQIMRPARTARQTNDVTHVLMSRRTRLRSQM
jgi:hypothetical protein